MSKAALLVLADRQKPGDGCLCPIHTLFPQRIREMLVPTLADLEAACDLIGKDTYGKPVWTPETIHPHNSVVQAFARHALTAAALRAIAAQMPDRD